MRTPAQEATLLARVSRTGPAPGTTTNKAPRTLPLRWAWRFGVALLLVQLGLMLAFSTVKYDRFALTNDFAIYTQAWWSIAHGHLDPYSSIIGMSFWRNNGEFILWPLSLLYYVDPSPLVLLWVQDVALAATELVALSWAAAILRRSRHRPRHRAIILGVAALALTMDPWAWDTIAFDFHSHVLAALFAVLLGRDLWAGHRRAWVWLPLTLACCGPAALYVVGIGAAALVTAPTRHRRVHAAAITSCGLAWLELLTTLGGAGLGGRGVTHWYGYLTPHHHPTILRIAAGIVLHPGPVLHLLEGRWPTALAFLLPVGLIGILSPWGLFPAATVLGPSIINASPLFFRTAASFQTWPALPFVLIGTVEILSRQSNPSADGRRRFLATCLAVWTGALVALASILLDYPEAWITVSPPAANTLAEVVGILPRNAEVIADIGIVGRFAERRDIRLLETGALTVDRQQVDFVLATGESSLSPSAQARAVQALERLHAHVILERHGVVVIRWQPPPGATKVTVP